jgi:hypothetical protein
MEQKEASKTLFSSYRIIDVMFRSYFESSPDLRDLSLFELRVFENIGLRN